MNEPHHFTDKFIAFIDILGFKSMVEAAEAGRGRSVAQIIQLTSKLGETNDERRFERYGPTLCPYSKYDQKNLDFRVTQVSDCAIVSSEISPAGLINLIQRCWVSVAELLVQGVMCRGFITQGLIHHKDGFFIGSGYHSAYSGESSVTAFKMEVDERGTPFVEIDPRICEYIHKSTDECVLKMFKRMTKTEEGVTALFPFKSFSHSFVIAGFNSKFDPVKEKEKNNQVRAMIARYRKSVLEFVDPTDEKVKRKVRHYVKALDEQMIACDQTDKIIDGLCSPFSSEKYYENN